MVAEPVQHFQSVIFEAWQLKVSAQLAEREVSGVLSFWMYVDHNNYLSLPTCGNEIKCCWGSFYVGVSGMEF